VSVSADLRLNQAARRLLCARCERPRCRYATQATEKLTPPHARLRVKERGS
jgi:hypothetical protein